MAHLRGESHLPGFSVYENAPPIGGAFSYMLDNVVLDIVQEELRCYTKQYNQDAGDDEQQAITGGDR